MQSVSIPTKVVSSSPVHGEVYSIQHYVIKFVSDLWQVGTAVSSTNKTDRYDITEILLKVASTTINHSLVEMISRKRRYILWCTLHVSEITRVLFLLTIVFSVLRFAASMVSSQRVPLVEQELPTLPEHMSFYCGSCYSIFSFMCMFCRSLFDLLSFSLWSLCCLFFFDLRFTDSNYPFGIFDLRTLITPLVSLIYGF